MNVRTTLNLSEDVIKEAEVVYNTKSKSEMVEKALKDAVKFKKLKQLMKLKGNIEFDEKSIEDLRSVEVAETEDDS